MRIEHNICVHQQRNGKPCNRHVYRGILTGLWIHLPVPAWPNDAVINPHPVVPGDAPWVELTGSDRA